MTTPHAAPADAPPTASTRRELLALALLAPLCVGLAWFACVVRWHSNANNVDTRTYLEMIQAVSRHGIPWIENGVPQRFPEMQAQWHVLINGRLWCIYPPVFPYLAVPFYRWGGVNGVIRFDVALLVVLALGTYALGRRHLRDPLLGTAAAYVTIASAPVWCNAHDTSSYTLALVLEVWFVYFALGALDTTARRARRHALVAGLLGGLATGTHLFVFPILAAVLALLFVLPADDVARPLVPVASLRDRFEDWLPTRGSLVRGAYAAVGAAVALAPVAALNHLRFGTWNPVTYGPCPWRSCVENGMLHQNAGAMILFLGPTLAWGFAGWAAWRAAGRYRPARAAVIVAAVLLVAPEGDAHRNAFFFLAVLGGYALDASAIPLDFPYHRTADGLGNLFGAYALKSTVQGTPALALALLAPGGTPAARRANAMLALPCAALYVLLAMRANMPSPFAVGYSFMHFRYAMPAVPMLAVLALAAVRALPWRWWHAVLVLALSAALYAWLVRYHDDLPLARREFLLRGTLAIAAVAFFLLARVRAIGRPPPWLGHAAAVAACAAFASGFATTNAVDLALVLRERPLQDAHLDAIARQTPARFALIGWAVELNQVLALRASRDVEYADLFEAQDWGDFHELVEYWTQQGRPVFGVFHVPVDPRTPFPDVELRVVDAANGLVRITLRR